MFNKISKITCAVIGLGRFGSSLAISLANSGTEIVVLDCNEEKVREMREYTENAFIVHKLDKKSLLDAGVQNCDVAIVCISERLDISILTTLNLVGLGVPKVIAKAGNSEHGEILQKLGAEVVYPEKDMAIRLASRLVTSGTLDIIQLSEKINISRLKVPDYLVNKTIVETKFRKKFHTNIIAIENNGMVTENPDPDYSFRSNDILFLVGSKNNLLQLAEKLKEQA